MIDIVKVLIVIVWNLFYFFWCRKAGSKQYRLKPTNLKFLLILLKLSLDSSSSLELVFDHTRRSHLSIYSFDSTVPFCKYIHRFPTSLLHARRDSTLLPRWNDYPIFPHNISTSPFYGERYICISLFARSAFIPFYVYFK